MISANDVYYGGRDSPQREQTCQVVFVTGEWLTAAQLEALQVTGTHDGPPCVDEWERTGQVFGVERDGVAYYARYQFDSNFLPRPVIKAVLTALGDISDPWVVAAWFHFPNAWLVSREESGAVNTPPKDSLEREGEVVRAAAARAQSYIA